MGKGIMARQKFGLSLAWLLTSMLEISGSKIGETREAMAPAISYYMIFCEKKDRKKKQLTMILPGN